MHANAQRRHANKPPTERKRSRSLSAQALRSLIASLEKAVGRLRWSPAGSSWQGYYGECDHYTPEALEQKKTLVAKFIDELAPGMVWDLGANTGVFSRIPAERGIPTVSFEYDPGCVEVNLKQVVAEGDRNVLPLVCDLTNPVAAIGWANRERMAFTERGPVDCALVLALVHHLAIANNVPLPLLASFFAEFARALVIEWVPKEDPKVQLLLATREDIFSGYTRPGFEQAFGERFTIEQAEQLPGSGRVLYLMRRRLEDVAGVVSRVP